MRAAELRAVELLAKRIVRLEERIADIHQHAILVSGVVPNDCPNRESLVEKIQAIGSLDND